MKNKSPRFRTERRADQNANPYDEIYSSLGLTRLSLNDQIELGKNSLGETIYLDTGCF